MHGIYMDTFLSTVPVEYGTIDMNIYQYNYKESVVWSDVTKKESFVSHRFHDVCGHN